MHSCFRVTTVLLGLLLMSVPVFSQNRLSIPNANSMGLAPVTMRVQMDNLAAVEGYVLAVLHTSAVEVLSVGASAVAISAGAELVTGEIFPDQGGFTLSVVLDAGLPFDGQTIPVGSSQDIAEFAVRPLVTDTITRFTFVDGVLNDPVLSNVIVIGGLSIGAGFGLGLSDGTLNVRSGRFARLAAEDASIRSDGCGGVRILLDNEVPVQGFVLALAHDSGVLTLDAIDVVGTVTEAAGAEFVVADTAAGGGTSGGTGGTLGVVLDFDVPFDGQIIAPGAGQHIATYRYHCKEVIQGPNPPVSTAVEFVNGTLGSPPVDNVVLLGGLSVSPPSMGGTVTCTPIDVGGVAFYCGNEDGQGEIKGRPGDVVNVCFYYSSDDAAVQGFQLAVCFDENLIFGDFVASSLLTLFSAEFVQYSVDNDTEDGDGCEFVASILLDALPPFDGQAVPQSVEPLPLGCVEVEIADDPSLCDSVLSIEFCNGANGQGVVAIENLAIIDSQPFQGIQFKHGAVYVSPTPTFIRGNCDLNSQVDLADAATVIGQQYGGLPVDCDDACDANDDGNVNLADAVFLLNYIFKSGVAPSDPGPDLDEGPDPTEDAIDCKTAPCPP